jgi:hypothetical protein
MTTTGINHSDELSHAVTAGEGSFFQSSEMTFESKKYKLIFEMAMLLHQLQQAFAWPVCDQGKQWE